MGRNLNLTDNGELRIFEGTGGGVNKVTLKTAATLTADYTLTLPDDDGGANEFLQTDGSGVLTWANSTATLDSAYDNGSVITADAGPIEATGAGGFQVTHSAPVVLLETTNASQYNWRITADQTADILEIQRGDQDADISDDTFDATFSLDGANRRIGLNTAAPSTSIHADSVAGDCKVTLESAATSDSSVIFNESGTAQYEIGYDQSAGGLVIGESSFTNPVIFCEDATFDVGIGELIPDARLHVTDSAAAVAKFESSSAGAHIVLVDSTTTDDTKVGVKAIGDDMRLVCDSIGIGTDTPAGTLEVQGASGITFVVDQDSTTATAARIDSASTSAPLLHLNGAAGNVEGQIRFAAQTAEPSGPVRGDMYYTSDDNDRFGCTVTSSTRNNDFCTATGSVLFGPGAVVKTLATGVMGPSTGICAVGAETPSSDDLDTITATLHKRGDCFILEADAGDTITVKHATGNILLDGSADKVLVNSNWFAVVYDGTNWRQLTPMMVLP